MKTNAKQIIHKATKGMLMLMLLFTLTQCYQDEDMNYRILVENNCDFAIKVYYDNQDIEYYYDGYIEDIDVDNEVEFIPPFGEKVIYSKYTTVWIEPEVNDLKSRKFRSFNDGSWHKIIDVYEEDFPLRY